MRHEGSSDGSMAKDLLAMAKDLLAMEFPTQDALDKYLKEHPDADKSLHKVKETKKPAEKVQSDHTPEKHSKYLREVSKSNFNRGTAEEAERIWDLGVKRGLVTHQEAHKALDYMKKNYKVEHGWGNVVGAEDALKSIGIDKAELDKRKAKLKE